MFSISTITQKGKNLLKVARTSTNLLHTPKNAQTLPSKKWGQAYMMLAVSIELLNSRFHALPSKILKGTPSNPCEQAIRLQELCLFLQNH